MPKLAFILCLAAGTLLTACQSTQPREGVRIRPVKMPQWALTGEHPDYPGHKFVVAFALARTPASAMRQAEDNLELAITREIMEQHRSLFANTQFEEVVRGTGAWISTEEFKQSIQRDEAGTGFDNVAMCAISRETLRLWAQTLLPQARKDLDETPEPPRAGGILLRMEAWGRYFLKAARVVAMGFLVEQALDRNAFAVAEKAAIQLWELPNLMRVSQTGGGSIARIGGGVADEFALYARFRDESAAGVPVVWALASNMRGSVRGDEVTDKSGHARCEVLQVTPNGLEGGQLLATLDLDRALGRRTGIVLPLWYWSIVLPCALNAELDIEITEVIKGAAEKSEPVLAPEFEKWAKLRGLEVRKDPAAESTRPYHVKLKGTLEVSSFEKDGEVIAWSTGSFELIDVKSGEILYAYGPAIQKTAEPGQSEAGLALAVRQEAAAEVMLEFMGRLTQLLPSSSDLPR